MDGKEKFKVFLIGFFACMAVFSVMGASEPGSQTSRFQISSFSAAAAVTNGMRGWSGYYVVDTYTGKVVDSKVERLGN